MISVQLIQIQLILNLKSKKVRKSKTYITIEDVKQLAINRGGKLLSDTYTNTQEKLKFECYLEHIFFISVNHIKMVIGVPNV